VGIFSGERKEIEKAGEMIKETGQLTHMGNFTCFLYLFSDSTMSF